MNKLHVTFTDKRVYWVTESNGLWHAHFQPLRPGTKTPWQASRGIPTGWDCYRLHNYRTGKYLLNMGVAPTFEDWSKDWTSLQRGFSTEALALAAIKNHK